MPPPWFGHSRGASCCWAEQWRAVLLCFLAAFAAFTSASLGAEAESKEKMLKIDKNSANRSHKTGRLFPTPNKPGPF